MSSLKLRAYPFLIAAISVLAATGGCVAHDVTFLATCAGRP